MDLEKIATILTALKAGKIPQPDWSRFGQGNISGSGWNPVGRLRKLVSVARGSEIESMASKMRDRHQALAGNSVKTVIKETEPPFDKFYNKTKVPNPDYKKENMFGIPDKEEFIEKSLGQTKAETRKHQEDLAGKLFDNPEKAKETLEHLRKRQFHAKLALGGIVAAPVATYGAYRGIKHALSPKPYDFNDEYQYPYR